MDDLQHAKTGRIPDFLPRVQQLLLHFVGMTGRMGDIKGENRRRHRNQELRMKSYEPRNGLREVRGKKSEERKARARDGGFGTSENH